MVSWITGEKSDFSMLGRDEIVPCGDGPLFFHSSSSEWACQNSNSSYFEWDSQSNNNMIYNSIADIKGYLVEYESPYPDHPLSDGCKAVYSQGVLTIPYLLIEGQNDLYSATLRYDLDISGFVVDKVEIVTTQP